MSFNLNIMSKYKEFPLMRKCNGVEKSLLRYSANKNEEIRILKTLLSLRQDELIAE